MLPGINLGSAKDFGFYKKYGDGRDGDVTIASGTTNVNSTKQYNNLTIQNGGILTSSTNKYLYLAVKRTLTIDSGGLISMRGKGSLGGVGMGSSGGNPGENGAGSGAGVEYLDFTTRCGSSGGGGGGESGMGRSYGGSGGAGYYNGGNGTSYNQQGDTTGDPGSNIPQIIKDRAIFNPNILLTMWGAGGGASGTSVSGGNGGGVVYIECYELIINESSTAIDVSGINGGSGGGYGSGAGSGGCIFIRYHILTNINGSNTNLKVAGGTGGIDTYGNGGNGGEGFYFMQMI